MIDSLRAIGQVQSPLKTLSDCPLQESEGAPPAVLKISAEFLDATLGIQKGTRLIVLTWLDRADRETLTTRPRNNPTAKIAGVFATRSPDRPNPIGLHEVEVLGISNDGEITVSNLEVLDQTPVIDLKIAL